MSDQSIRESRYFDVNRVAALLKKIRQKSARKVSERDNMALVGILSTQILDHQFIRNNPSASCKKPKHLSVKILDDGESNHV